MTGMYSSGEYDLAGFVVGAVERGQMLLGLQRAEEEDVLIGLASSGIHGCGFSIIRKILLISSLHYSSPAPGSCGDKTLGTISFISKANLQMNCVQTFPQLGAAKGCLLQDGLGLVEFWGRSVGLHLQFWKSRPALFATSQHCLPQKAEENLLREAFPLNI